MKFEIDLPYSKKFVCWVNELPSIKPTETLGVIQSIPVFGKRESHQLNSLAIELLIPGFAGSMYGLLGLTLEESTDGCLIEIKANDDQDLKYTNTIVQSESESVFCGLPSEYVDETMKAMLEEVQREPEIYNSYENSY